MNVKLVADFKHWLLGVNWFTAPLVEEELFILAFHLGPWCLMLERKEKAAGK